MLESILDNLAINEVFEKADQAKDKYVTAQKEFYELLMYLDRTKRYKEDRQYAKTSFDLFLRTRYNMTYKTYQETRTVLFEFEEAAEKHGAGFVRGAIRRVGKIKAREALDELDDVQAKRKKPLKLADKQAVVERFAMPVPEKTKRETPRTDWEFAFKQEHKRADALQRERDDLKHQIDVVAKRNNELQFSIGKIQKTLQRERALRQEAETMIDVLHKQLETKDTEIATLRRANSFVPPNGVGQGRRLGA